MKINYNWLQDYLGETLAGVGEVESLLTKHAFEIDGVKTVAGEAVLDVDVLPNRSSDCLCHRGVARELATITNTQLMHDPLATAPELQPTTAITVAIADAAACPRFTASLMTGITVKESPDWLKTRLESIGQRSINNIVDATNYVMFAIGQPLHAYDADLFPKTDGQWQFAVRYATKGESVRLLAEGGGESERIIECRGDELLIVDNSSNTPIGLAGVKGGQYAAVHSGTTNIIVEAAHFDSVVTRKTARRLGIVIDASKRFENEPARELAGYAQSEIVTLILKIAGGQYQGTYDEYLQKKLNPVVTVTQKSVNGLLGLQLSLTEISQLIEKTGSTVTQVSEDALHCTGPFERTDLLIEADYIEEVGRLYGLNNIVSVAPQIDADNQVNQYQYYSELVRQTLLQAGFSEVITSSFQKKDNIQLQNALASDKSYMRSTLINNLRRALDENFYHLDLLGLRSVRVFEIGTVFDKTADNVTEHVSLALGVRTKGNGYTPKDDAPLQQAIDTLSEALGCQLPFAINAAVAELNFTDVISTLDTPPLYLPMPERSAAVYAPVSMFPAISRDIALFVAADTDVDSVVTVINNAAGSLRVRTDLFDEFTKDGRTSLAFRIVFQSTNKTLTDAEVAACMDAVNQAVAAHGWEVR